MEEPSGVGPTEGSSGEEEDEREKLGGGAEPKDGRRETMVVGGEGRR